MLVPAEEVVRRLEEARATHGGGLLAFDADGTLWDGDVGVDLFEAALRERVLRAEATEALSGAAKAAGVAVAQEPNHQAALLYQAFLADRLHDGVMFEIMAWAFAGFSTAEMSAFAAHVLQGNDLLARVTLELEPVLAWARHAGDVEVMVVSASPRAIVEPGVVVRNLSARAVIAMTPNEESGRIVPGVVAPAPYAEGKALALRAAAGERTLLGAFGDSGFDAELLRLARVPVMVRPKATLRQRAQTIPGLLEIERRST